ncbi:FadR family transcriptional regulator [Alphaproteobacteria bacterium KMM 3653]|uniref:Pyruvate dehydrogenase complex repressor n=1 Tax=Harenicola maris TaxID=2841044 RepID=A0AAP2CT91_9RHOB|nr:FadR family transcriptional regulator [Harenicola maris]
MPFTPVSAGKISDAVVRQIEELILRGVLHPGERLPAERDLSERMGVSRPSLRAAIAELQEAGLLETRKGAGIFVSDALDAAFPEALVRLFATHEDALFDTLDFRRDIEGLAAARAAQHGSATDLKLIAALMEKMEDDPEPDAESLLDAEFHMAIVEAGHNAVMVHVMRSLYQVLRRTVVANRNALFMQDSLRSAVLKQHRAVNDAIQARDPDKARQALEAHLDFVKSALRDQITSGKHDAIAQLRLAQEQERGA